MDDLEKSGLLLACQRQFPVQPLQGHADLRHIGFEVYGFNGESRLGFSGSRSHFLFLPRAMASLASLSAVRRRSVSRLSHSCLPLARASSTFTLPFLKYMRVGMRVSPFCWVLPISLRISSLCMSSLRVRRGAWLWMLPCS